MDKARMLRKKSAFLMIVINILIIQKYTYYSASENISGSLYMTIVLNHIKMFNSSGYILSIV